jgi:hypothetical protein
VHDPWFTNRLCFAHQPEAVVELYYFDALSTSSSSNPSSTYRRKRRPQKPRQPPKIIFSARTRRRRKLDDRHRDVSALVTFGGFMTASAMTDGFILVKP